MRILQSISSQKLFYAILSVFLMLATLFCVSIAASANRANIQAIKSLETQVLRILQEGGASGLASSMDSRRRVVQPGSDRLEIAMIQNTGNRRRVLFESFPGFAAATMATSETFHQDGEVLMIHLVDVANASKEWALPVKDIDLMLGIQTPSFETRRARRLIAYVAIISLVVCSLMLILNIAHWRRYRDGIEKVNGLLVRYSAGETGIRFEGETPVPELQELERQLNDALPKIDGLFADLRSLSAHLAHELRTPLQTIRSGLRKLVREDEADARKRLAQTINKGIDVADAQLQSIMQLFRLQADADIALEEGLAIGEFLEDLVLDFEAALISENRSLEMDIDKAVVVTGNQHLLELLISNLLSNAAKYAASNSQVSVKLLQEGARFQLRITNASQLAEGQKSHFFERYAQADPHSSVTGYGLGLALVRAIAQKHGFVANLVVAENSNEITAIVSGKIGETEEPTND